MKRIMLSAMGAGALALTVPGAALAHRGHEVVHHRHHHHHKVHLRKVRIVHIRAGSTTVTPPVQTPVGPGPAAGQGAASVVSFTNGVLTLELADGSKISGAVTAATRIECETASAPPTAAAADHQGGQGPGDGRQESSGPGSGPGRGDQSGGDNDGDDDNGNNDNDNDEHPGNGERMPCDTSALVPGAVVREAELRVDPSGSRFTSVELAK